MTGVRTPTAPPTDDALARVAHELRGRLACIIYALKGVPSGDGAVDKARGIAERQARRRRGSSRTCSTCAPAGGTN